MNQPFKTYYSSTSSGASPFLSACGAKSNMQAPENTQNYNRYAYCLNNPMKYTDPSGYLTGYYIDECGNIIGWDGNKDHVIHLVYGADKKKVNETTEEFGFEKGTSLSDLIDPKLVPERELRLLLEALANEGRDYKLAELAQVLFKNPQGSCYSRFYKGRDNTTTGSVEVKGNGNYLKEMAKKYHYNFGVSTEDKVPYILAHVHNQDGDNRKEYRPPSEGDGLEDKFIDHHQPLIGIVFDYSFHGERTYIYDTFTEKLNGRTDSWMHTHDFFKPFYSKDGKIGPF